MLIDTHHFCFTVGDMDRSLRFYRDLLGLHVTHDWVTEAEYLRTMIPLPGLKLRIVFLGLPGTHARLELIDYLEPRGHGRAPATNVPGSAHVCFDVSDIDALYRRLQAAGVEFNSAPVLITSQANYGARAVYLRDPDGNALELRQPAPGI